MKKKIICLLDELLPSYPEVPDEKNLPLIYVDGKAIQFDKITPEITDQMNEVEKEAYKNVISDLYSQVYNNF